MTFKGNGDLLELYKLCFQEKKLLLKFTGSLIVSSGSALCFPLAMVITTQKDIYTLCTSNTKGSDIVKSVTKWTAIFTVGALATYYRRLSIDQLVFPT